jgi:hypothetical protein
VTDLGPHITKLQQDSGQLGNFRRASTNIIVLTDAFLYRYVFKLSLLPTLNLSVLVDGRHINWMLDGISLIHNLPSGFYLLIMSQAEGDSQPSAAPSKCSMSESVPTSTVVTAADNARQRRKIAALEEKLQELEAGRMVKQRYVRLDVLPICSL